MSTTPEPGFVPPAQIAIQATPDGKFIVLQVAIFFELPNAAEVGEALTNLSRQLKLGLILPGNGQTPPMP